MISLTLTEKEVVYENSDERYAVGRIRINGFSEIFHASLAFWTREDYFRHWRNVLESILLNSSCGLVTNMVNPEVGRFVTWWPVYREGRDIYVQNAMLFLKNIPVVDRNNVDAWQNHVAPRATSNEDGQRISEWSAVVKDVEKFLVELNARL